MKPISLEIKGFQSFRDVQKIDFSTLTAKGLFGIFGPTGSGKSTILDAIMFALYGKVSKESQNEYINLNEKETYVQYTFALSNGDQHHHYVVKRLNKKNNANKYGTASVTLSEIITNPDGTKETIVLGEGVRDVNGQVESLIGLKLEDFTRSVVLPQGKFSEFLKIEPSKRNEMLERIFGLEKYGKRITEKIKNELKVNKQALETKEEILGRYDDVSDEKLKQLKEELHSLIQQEKEKEESHKEVLKEYEEAKEVRDLQQELETNKENERELSVRSEEFKQKEEQVKRAKQAGILLPFMKECNVSKTQWSSTIKELEEKQNDEQQIISQHEAQQKLLESAKLDKETKTPGLLIKKHELEGILQDVLTRSAVTTELAQLQEEQNKHRTELEVNEKDLQKAKNEKAKKDEGLKNKKSLMATLEVSTKFRTDVSQAVDLQKTIGQLRKSLKEFEDDQLEKQKRVNRDQEDLKQYEADFTSLQKNLQTKQDELKEWQSKPVWTHEDFQFQQKLILEQDSQLKSFQEKQQTLQEKQKSLESATEEVQTIQNSLMSLNDQRGKLQEKYRESKARYENLKINNYAGIIAEQLSEEDPCPVCGNTHKVQLAGKTDHDDLEIFEKEMELDQKQFDDVKLNIATLEAQWKLKSEAHQTVTNEYEMLSSELKGFIFTNEKEKLEELQRHNQGALQAKNEIEEKITLLSNEITQMDRDLSSMNTKMAETTTSIAGLSTQIEEINGKRARAQEELVTHKQNLKPLQDEYHLEDFEKVAKEINEKDKQREVTESEVRALERASKELEASVEKLTHFQNENEKLMLEMTNNMNTKKKELEDLHSKIYKVCEDRDASFLLDEVIASIKKLEETVSHEEEMVRKLADSLKEIRENVVTLQNTKKLQGENVQKLDQRVQQLLIEFSFQNEAEVVAMYLDEQSQLVLEEEITKYKESVESTKTLIKSVLDKLKGRSLTEEQWNELNEKKDRLATALEQIKKEKTGMEKDIQRMDKDLEQVRELKKEVKTLTHRHNMLDELSKLMRGNSFIEFISFGQLKYVAREASNRLMEITKGKFSLILSEETKKFLICDHTSGGYTRSTDTLSGGELFLTSLSLALALSTHIQLKNSAPLEFFFLDEGFGTLDDNILDTAMNSLEKLHSDRLSVGIISHVKEIQERVPVKLLVTPASSGVGSKVRMEYS